MQRQDISMLWFSKWVLGKSGRSPGLPAWWVGELTEVTLNREFQGRLRTPSAGKAGSCVLPAQDGQGQSPGGMKDTILEAPGRLMPLGHADCT